MCLYHLSILDNIARDQIFQAFPLCISILHCNCKQSDTAEVGTAWEQGYTHVLALSIVICCRHAKVTMFEDFKI